MRTLILIVLVTYCLGQAWDHCFLFYLPKSTTPGLAEYEDCEALKGDRF